MITDHVFRILWTIPNYNMQNKKEKYVDNDVFKFRVSLGCDFKDEDITIYTKPFPKLPLLDKSYNAVDLYKEYDKQEDLVQEKYFTQERIEELKLKFIQKIQECPNPFNICCVDRDGGYNVTEEELFDIEK